MSYKTIIDISIKLNVSESTIKRLIYAEKIKAIKVGRQWRISEEELERLKKEGIK